MLHELQELTSYKIAIYACCYINNNNNNNNNNNPIQCIYSCALQQPGKANYSQALKEALQDKII
jgi:hypothetical protein